MFQYLNHDNRWPRFRLAGLEIDPQTGTIALRRLPGTPRPIATLPGDAAAAVLSAGLCAAALLLTYPRPIHAQVRGNAGPPTLGLTNGFSGSWNAAGCGRVRRLLRYA